MYCGIDVAKNKSQVCILDKDKKIVKEFEIKHTKDGFTELENHLTPDAKIGLEVTGNYCKALYYYFKEKYDIRYVDNHQMKNFAKLQNEHIKNDKFDAKQIAIYLSFDFKTFDLINVHEVKDLSRLYYKTLKNLTRYKYMFKDQINVIFPELEKHCYLTKSRVIAGMLLKYPTPHDIAESDTSELRHELIKDLKRGSKFTVEYTKKLQELAKNSIGVKNYPVDSFKYTIKIMLYYQNLIEDIKKKMKECLEKTPYHQLLEKFGYNIIGFRVGRIKY